MQCESKKKIAINLKKKQDINSRRWISSQHFRQNIPTPPKIVHDIFRRHKNFFSESLHRITSHLNVKFSHISWMEDEKKISILRIKNITKKKKKNAFSSLIKREKNHIRLLKFIGRGYNVGTHHIFSLNKF